MKRFIYGMLLLAMFPPTTAAWDTRPATKERIVRPPVDWNEVLTHYVDTAYWCIVDVNVITPPQPLAPARMTVTFSIHEDYPNYRHQSDIEFIMGHPIYELDWLSPERFVWPAPRKIGDQFTIDIEFISLVSGNFEFFVGEIGSSWRHGDPVTVEWSLDAEGTLTSLRNGRYGTLPTRPLSTEFFDEEIVHIKYASTFGAGTNEWDCAMEIEPPFSIGDTSTVTYYLSPKEYIPDGFDFRLSGEHMEIVSYPQRVNHSIGPGETVELVLEVVPAAVRDIQNLTLRFAPVMIRGESSRSQVGIKTNVLFNEDGSLRYVGKRHRWYLDESMYPSSFPKADDRGGFRSKIIHKDKPHPYASQVK